MPIENEALAQAAVEFAMLMGNEQITSKDLGWSGIRLMLETYAVTKNVEGARKFIERLRKLES